MSIKKVSDLDSYLSTNTNPSQKEPFILSTFQNSLFEISKRQETVEQKFNSRKIDGTDMLSAMYFGLSNNFADITYLSNFNKKIEAVVNLFGFVYNAGDDSYTVTSFRLGDNNYFTNVSAHIVNLSCNNISADNGIYNYLSVNQVIDGTARRALWS